jgi:hypothetical protein
VKELEDNILFKLATAQGDITEDVELIEGLESTKKIANEISIKQVRVRVRVRVRCVCEIIIDFYLKY